MAESQLTLILEENGQLRAHRIDAPSVTIGRTADNAVRVSDALSSRQHCQVELKGGSYWVQDLKSRNGTKLNGKSLTEPTELKPGDRIQVGDSIVHFQERQGATSKRTSARQRGPLAEGTRFRLRVLGGAAEAKAAVVTSLPFVLGSKESCGLVLTEDDVAGEHVMLVGDRGQVHLVDLSGDRTALDGKPVRGRVLLQEGSKLQLGAATTLRVEVPSSKSSSRSSARKRGAAAGSARKKAESARRREPEPEDEVDEVPLDEVEELSSLDEDDDDGSKMVEVVAREGDVGLDDVDLGARLEAAAQEEGGKGGGVLGLVLLPLIVLLAAGGLFWVGQSAFEERLADPQPENNRLRNWSFEEVGADGKLPGWDLLAGAGQAARDANVAGYGRASLTLRPAAPEEPEVRSEKIRVSAGSVYRVRAATSHTAGAAAVLRVDWSRESDPDWSRQTVAVATDFKDRGWKDVSGLVVAPLGATHAQLAAAASGNGEVRFDRMFMGEATSQASDDAPAEALEPAWEVLSGPQGLEVWADPHAVITVMANETDELVYGLGLAAPDRVKDALGHQRSARIDQPLGWQADESLLAIGTLPFPAPQGTQFDFVAQASAEELRLRWTLGRDAEPLPLVFTLPARQRIEALAFDGQPLPPPSPSGSRLEEVAEMTWGREEKQVSFRFTAPATVTVYPHGSRGAFVVLSIPPRKLKNGDLRLGFDLGGASLGRGAKVQERFKEAREARGRGALTRALEVYQAIEREFNFDAEVVARAKREAASIRALAEELLGAVRWAQAESRRLAHPAFARAARAALTALERDFAGTSELDRARTATTEIEERVESERATELNGELARLNRSAQEHVRQGREALARLIYRDVVRHDASLAEVRKAQAALQRLEEGK
ncbi:MAG: FHA domain-containing protein [Planctomycetota bacterium]